MWGRVALVWLWMVDFSKKKRDFSDVSRGWKEVIFEQYIRGNSLKTGRMKEVASTGICQPQHTILPRIHWPNGSTTPAPDFAPPHPTCIRVIRNWVFQNTQFRGDQSKEELTVRSTIWHLFLIWLTADLMAGSCDYPWDLWPWREQLNLDSHGWKPWGPQFQAHESVA